MEKCVQLAKYPDIFGHRLNTGLEFDYSNDITILMLSTKKILDASEIGMSGILIHPINWAAIGIKQNLITDGA